MKKILVVDDSSLSQSVVKRTLEPRGFELLTACDGEQGLKIIESEKPDCVILDLLMPVLTGFEVLEALRDRHNEVPVIVVSADIQETTRQRVMSLGARQILSKPVKGDVLIETIEIILGQNGQEAA